MAGGQQNELVQFTAVCKEQFLFRDDNELESDAFRKSACDVRFIRHKPDKFLLVDAEEEKLRFVGAAKEQTCPFTIQKYITTEVGRHKGLPVMLCVKSGEQTVVVTCCRDGHKKTVKPVSRVSLPVNITANKDMAMFYLQSVSNLYRLESSEFPGYFLGLKDLSEEDMSLCLVAVEDQVDERVVISLEPPQVLQNDV